MLRIRRCHVGRPAIICRPVECLGMLSNIYQISINEILAGERVSNEKFVEVADDNLTIALEELQKENQKFENKMIWVLVITSILAIAIIMLLPMQNVKDVIVVIMVVAMAFIANTLNLVAMAVKKESNGN